MLNIVNLKKEFGNNGLFENLSFSLEKNQSLALVGKNGSGKTTLLEIIMGINTQDSGNINNSFRSVEYLPQNVDKFFENYFAEESLKNILNTENKDVYKYFDIKNFDLNKKISEFSIGQKMKIAMGIIFSRKPALFLMDEPTNNLDIKSIKNLKDIINGNKSTYIIVSHDDNFMESCTRNLLELGVENPKLIKNQSYIEWREHEKRKYDNQLKEYNEKIKKAKKIKKVGQMFHEVANPKNKKQKIFDEGDKHTRQSMKSGFEKMEARAGLKKKEAEEMIKNTEKPKEIFKTKLEINKDVTKSNPCINLDSVELGYLKSIVKNININFQFGSRTVITGENGSGKTTLIKTITKEIEPLSGKLTVDGGVRFGIIDQKRIGVSEGTLFDYFKDKFNVESEDIFNRLKNAGISESSIKDSISKLSMGEKTRALFVQFSFEGVNTLILDEPTNHLDLDGIFAIEDVLNSFKGTLILISHNGYFINKCKIDKHYYISNEELKLI